MSALTALEIRELTNFLKPFLEREYLDRVYPIGSLYFSATDVNPSALFGGTWERIKDRFLLASGDKYATGSMGGSADAIVVDHKHKGIYFKERIKPVSTKANPPYNDTYGVGLEITLDDNVIYSGDVNGLTTESAGESGTGKNMPPYLSVCVWKRIA